MKTPTSKVFLCKVSRFFEFGFVRSNIAWQKYLSIITKACLGKICQYFQWTNKCGHGNGKFIQTIEYKTLTIDCASGKGYQTYWILPEQSFK
jgi:hypothetical protein